MGRQRSPEQVKSIDTNVLVRVMVLDDPFQVSLAESILAKPVFVTDGVLMEAEWVLRSRYRMSRQEIAEALTRILDVETVSTAEPTLTQRCLSQYAAGADLSDMLHLSASRGLDAFVSFDRDLASQAGPDTPIFIERLG